jgi:hypothetical protein
MRGDPRMTIEIDSLEVEAIIRSRMSAGGFQSAEEVILQALKSSPAAEASVEIPHRPEGRKSLAQLFADSPFKGLNIDFERDPDCGRDIIL